VKSLPSPAGTVPRPRGAREEVDARELEWADDPMTGMRVPTFFLDP
jgi:hypothetical protein